jgi:sugar/nucleoside kinase (ribokinase family)
MKSLNADHLIYEAMIGTGGIGSGMFFSLNGSHTLGREESRSGRLENRKDYCKLHIIAHYVKSLMGETFPVFPVGKIGNDDAGNRLLDEIKEAGMDTSFISTDPAKSTLFSFCFLYPDNSGGNMTTDDSASSSVDPSAISAAEKIFKKYSNKGIALAAPEVPLPARRKLLELAAEYNFFRAASFTSGEMDEALSSGILKKTDLLAINLDEALHAVKSPPANDTAIAVDQSIKAFCAINPGLKLTITNGKEGSWAWDGSEMTFFPALNVKAISTAGAGDAFTAGVIAGITCGLSLKNAQQLGTLTGGASVTSPHTINKDITRNMLKDLAKDSGYPFCKEVIKLLEA